MTYPIITEEGILLIYNSADFSTIYRPGAALFDISNPRKLIMRTDRFLAEPELIWEKQGQVPNVIFIEGAVVHEEKLILYYGAADTYIGAFVVDLGSELESLVMKTSTISWSLPGLLFWAPFFSDSISLLLSLFMSPGFGTRDMPRVPIATLTRVETCLLNTLRISLISRLWPS